MSTSEGFGWAGFAGGIAVALLWGAGMVAVKVWGGPSTQALVADPSCDPSEAACEVELSQGTLSLQIDPRGAPPDQPLEFTVRAPPGVSPTHLVLRGRSMAMGDVRIPLTLIDEAEGRYVGTGRLPVCIFAEMEWGAEVVAEPDTSAVFTVWSLSGGVVVDGSVVPAVEPTYPGFSFRTASGTQSLSDWKGDAVVVYFGYTSCPDICPTTLAAVAGAFHQLPEEFEGRAHGVLVTLDPDRDGLERLATYTDYFHPQIVGGQIDDLVTIAPAWGMSWRKVELPDSALGYVVDHGTDAYLVGPSGDFVQKLPHGLSSEAIKNAVVATLREADAGLEPAPSPDP